MGVERYHSEKVVAGGSLIAANRSEKEAMLSETSWRMHAQMMTTELGGSYSEFRLWIRSTLFLLITKPMIRSASNVLKRHAPGTHQGFKGGCNRNKSALIDLKELIVIPKYVSLLHPAEVGGTLTIESFAIDGQQVIEGILRTSDPSVWYPIIQGVPSFLSGPMQCDLSDFCARYGLPQKRNGSARPKSVHQVKTNVTFSDKWRRFKQYGLQPEHKEFLFGWYCKKLGVPDLDALKDFYRSKKRVLEVGPGSGFNTRFIAENCPGEVFALDVSDAAFTTFENTRDLQNCCVVQADLMEAPFPDDTFDFIIADGVLHHTPNTRSAVEALFKKVRPGGQFFFYVYRKMGAARVFTDDHMRQNFMPLSAEGCYAACEGITELGRELSRLNATSHT